MVAIAAALCCYEAACPAEGANLEVAQNWEAIWMSGGDKRTNLHKY